MRVGGFAKNETGSISPAFHQVQEVDGLGLEVTGFVGWVILCSADR